MKTSIVFLICIGAALSAKIPHKLHREHPVFSNKNVQQKIVNGQEAVPHSIPYQVGLFLDGHFCGGTLISDRYVLTAAHCGEITNRPEVVLGAHEVESETEDHITISGSKVTVHEGWNSNTLENDVSVIQLSQAVSLSDKIQPVQLAPSDAGTYAGRTANASGWGKTRDSDSWISPVLRVVSNPILSNSDCERLLDEDIPIWDSLICFAGDGNKSTCNGDSGGPLVVDENGTPVQVGVTSWVVDSGCAAGFPSGFSRVSSFRNWIRENTGV